MQTTVNEVLFDVQEHCTTQCCYCDADRRQRMTSTNFFNDFDVIKPK